MFLCGKQSTATMNAYVDTLLLQLPRIDEQNDERRKINQNQKTEKFHENEKIEMIATKIRIIVNICFCSRIQPGMTLFL